MSPILKTFATWKELTGTRPTHDEVLTHLKRFDRLDTTILMFRLSVHLAVDRFLSEPSESVKLQEFFLRNFIDDALFDTLRTKFGQERLDARYIFHRQQVLTAAKWTILNCPSAGGAKPDDNKNGLFEIGRSLIKTSDLLQTDDKELMRHLHGTRRKKKCVALQLMVGSALEINNPPDIKPSVSRSEWMFSENLNSIHLPIDIAQAFKASTGLELEEYIDLIIGALVNYTTRTQGQLIENPALFNVNPKTYFSSLPAEKAARFWELEMSQIEDMVKDLANSSSLKSHHDFTVFRMKPFLRVSEEAAICVNPGFLLEKLETGLFWRICNSLPAKEQRDQLFNAWGLLFEQYAHSLLQSGVRAETETYLPFPKFTDTGEEAFDGVVFKDNKCVVLEHKGGFLKATAKYAENEEEFLKDVDLKFGLQPGAGLEQLARKINHVFSARPENRRAISGLDISRIQAVIPVLIVQEPFISSEITALWLWDEFLSYRSRSTLVKPVCSTGVLVLDIGDLEILRPYMLSRQVSLCECLMERARVGPAALSFRDFFRDFCSKNGLPVLSDADVDQRFDRVMDRVCIRFFGKPMDRSARSGNSDTASLAGGRSSAR